MTIRTVLKAQLRESEETLASQRRPELEARQAANFLNLSVMARYLAVVRPDASFEIAQALREEGL